MIRYFERKLRLTDLEVWDIQCGEDIYRMFISDENRPPKTADLDLPSTISMTEEDVRENLIKVSVYSNTPVKDEHIEYLDQFSKQLTDHVALAHCHIILSFYTGFIDDIFDQILKEKANLEYEKIPLQQLWHLHQN